jgi:signal transduction histidine kinase
MTLRWRVALWSLAILAGTQFALLGLTYAILQRSLWRDAERYARVRATNVAERIEHEDEEHEPRTWLLSRGALSKFSADGAVIRLLDAHGMPVALPTPAGTAGVPAPGASDAPLDPHEMAIARREVRLQRARYASPLTVSVGWPLGTAHQTLARVGLILAGLGGLTLLLGVLITFALVGRALSPIEQVSRLADAYSAGDLSRRLPGGEAGDEVGRMVVAFNRLLARLEAAFQRERRFTSDAAHELRTPLTILRGEVELALRAHPDGPEAECAAPTPLRGVPPPPGPQPSVRATLYSIKEEIEHLEGLVTNLLALARSETAQAALAAEPVSLLELSSDVIGRLGYLARAQGVGIEVSPDSTDQTVRGDPITLRQAIFNVIQNGVRHSPAGGTVRVRVAGANRHAVVEVRDEGPGIPEAAMPHLFDRFFRADSARTRLPGRAQGLGLGLAITRAVVQAHGGAVHAENLSTGGAQFTIALPVTEETNGRL